MELKQISMSIADSRFLKLFKVGATDGMTTTFVSTFHINNCVIGKYFGVKIISTFAPHCRPDQKSAPQKIYGSACTLVNQLVWSKNDPWWRPDFF